MTDDELRAQIDAARAQLRNAAQALQAPVAAYDLAIEQAEAAGLVVVEGTRANVEGLFASFDQEIEVLRPLKAARKP